MINQEFDNYQLALDAYDNGQYKTVIKYCNAALKDHKYKHEVLSLMGKSFLLLHKLDKAEEYFRSAIEDKDSEGEYYFDLANSLFGQELLSEATKYYSIAEQKGISDESKKKMYYIVGLINQVGGNYKSALHNFDRAEKMKGVISDNKKILLQKLKIYMQNRDYSNAEQCSMELKLLFPDDYRSYQLLYRVFLQQQKYKKALSVLDEAEEIFKEIECQIEIKFDEALLYCIQAEMKENSRSDYYDKAIEVLRKIISFERLNKKDYYEAQLNISEIYLKLDNPMKAIEKARDVVGIDKETEELIELIDKAIYINTESYLRLKDYSQVLKYAKKMKLSKQAYYKYHGYYYEAMASKLLLRTTEMYTAAIAYYKSCAFKNPNDFYAHLFRIRCYVDVGKVENAKELANVLPEDIREQAEVYLQGVTEIIDNKNH